MQSINKKAISMGKPITAPVLIPVEHKSTPTCICEPFMADGECYKVTCVSFGSPHGAVLVDDVEHTDVERVGRLLGTHVLFPEGASIVFIQVLNRNQLRARLWQRGEGESYFSPEAACVALTVATMLQKVMWEAEVLMGDYNFHVKWDSADGNVYLSEIDELMLQAMCG